MFDSVIARRLSYRTYKIIGLSDSEFVFDVNSEIYHVISVENDLVEIANDGLDDPSTTDFFVVSGNVALFRGEAVRIERHYVNHFSKFAIPLMKRAWPKL